MLQYSPVFTLGFMDALVYDRIFTYMITFKWVLGQNTHLIALFHNKHAGLKEQILTVGTAMDITEAAMINHMWFEVITGYAEEN